MSHASHVLLVEDSELVTSAMAILFESVGYRLSIAASVAQAIEIGSRDAADLVLLDLTLPDGDGLAAIGPLRASGSKIFVALTGRDDPQTRVRCLAAGCTDVLLKPVPARELLARCAALIA